MAQTLPVASQINIDELDHYFDQLTADIHTVDLLAANPDIAGQLRPSATFHASISEVQDLEGNTIYMCTLEDGSDDLSQQPEDIDDWVAFTSTEAQAYDQLNKMIISWKRMWSM